MPTKKNTQFLKGITPTLKERAEVCTVLSILKTREACLSNTIQELREYLQKNYWSKNDRTAIFYIVLDTVGYCDSFPQITGIEKE